MKTGGDMVREIEAVDWAAPEFSPKPRPQKRHVGASLLMMMALLTVGLGASATHPPAAEGYIWGPWATRYFLANDTECLKARAAAKKFIGPIQYYFTSTSCIYRAKVRKTVASSYNPLPIWTDYKLEIEVDAPVWPAWGSRMIANVHWNGSIAMITGTPECRPFSFAIKVTLTRCDAVDSRTNHMAVRMAYDASFDGPWGFYFSKNHGVDQVVTGSGLGERDTW